MGQKERKPWRWWARTMMPVHGWRGLPWWMAAKDAEEERGAPQTIDDFVTVTG